MEDGGTGAEEVVSFIDLPPNSHTKPEKGILKKHGGYGIVIPDSWKKQEKRKKKTETIIINQRNTQTINEIKNETNFETVRVIKNN